MTMLAFRKLRADERGAAIIELAIVAPVFALMAIGIVDMSNAFSRKLALEQGAHRAIEKIMQTTEDDTVEGTLTSEAVCQVNGTNADGTCKTSPITTSNVTVTYRLECTAAGGAITAQTSTDSTAFDLFTCASGTTKEARYIQVDVTDKYTPMFPVHFISFNTGDGTYHLSASAGMRTQ
jgi:Flp pilus assembly protein TadG